MNIEKLDAHDITVVCECINSYGDDNQGVIADKNTLEFFHVDYAKKCMSKALGNKFIRTDIKVQIRKIKDTLTD